MKRASGLILILWLVLFAAFAHAEDAWEQPAVEENAAVYGSIEVLSSPKANLSIYDADLNAGEGVELWVRVPNDPDAQYQWYSCPEHSVEGAAAIPGATQSVYRTDAFYAPEMRSYCCIIESRGETVCTDLFHAAYTGLPTLMIDTPQGEAVESKELWLEETRVELVSAQQEYCFADSQAKIKRRGNSSYEQPKHPFTIKLSDKFEVLGMNKAKKWVLVGNYSDKTLIRNAFAYGISNSVFDGMDWNPSGSFVDLILNGEYLGTYLLCESIEIGKNRVDIPNASEEDDINNGGFIFEVDFRMDEDFCFETSRGSQVALKDPEIDDFYLENEDDDAQIRQYIIDLFEQIESAVYSGKYADVIDVDSFVDWYIVNEIAKNTDAVWHSSVYLYYDPADGKMHMGPAWDFDIAFGNTKFNPMVYETGFFVSESGWYQALFNDAEFMSRVKKRWLEVREELTDAVETGIQEMADELCVSAEINFEKWDILGRYVWPNPNGYDVRTSYQSEVDYLVAWLGNRIAWMDAMMSSEGNPWRPAQIVYDP